MSRPTCWNESSHTSNCQMTVILQVPTIWFAQRQFSREVRLFCPFEHMPVIDNSMMLPKSTCSTLAILIAFSRYPSTASCVVTATGSDFTKNFRLVFAGSVVPSLQCCAFTNGPFPTGLQFAFLPLRTLLSTAAGC